MGGEAVVAAEPERLAASKKRGGGTRARRKNLVDVVQVLENDVALDTGEAEQDETLIKDRMHDSRERLPALLSSHAKEDILAIELAQAY